MSKFSRVLVVCALLVGALVGPRSAEAASLQLFNVMFPYTDPASGTTYSQFQVSFDFDQNGGLSQATLGSADLDLSAFLNDPIFNSSAPTGDEQIVPPGSPSVAVFKMPQISTSSFYYDAGSDSTFALFGPGVFALESFGTCADPICWLSANFDSAALQLVSGVPTYFLGNADYAGPLFDASGLVNPGAFSFAFGPSSGPSTESVTVNVPALGLLEAQSVPEPGTLSLLGIGIAAVVTQRWRSVRDRAES